MKVRLDPRTTVLEDGHLLVGGAPLTVQRLRRPAHDTTHDTTLGRRWLDTGMGRPVLDPADAVAAGDLTVVIPVRDRPDQLARCRAALRPLRVVVVDDASTNPVTDAMRLDTNLGPAGARNAGLGAVTTPYVAFVDSDVEVAAHDLLRLTAHFADPAVAAVAPRVRGRSTPTSPTSRQRWWQRYDAAFSSLDLGTDPAPVRRGAPISYLPSACLVARTDCLGTGFDPALRVGEDVDLVWRLLAAGHAVRYDPTVIAHHDTRPSLRSWLAQSFGYGTSAAPLADRHGSAVAPACLSPSLAVVALALLDRRRWAVPLAVTVSVPVVRRLRASVPLAVALSVTGRSLAWAVRQESSLVVRHWWPAVVAGCLVSRRVRRVTATAVAVDTIVSLADRRRLDAGALVVGRRVTDLAYGAGVWRGAVQHRSVRSLLPVFTGLRPTRAAPPRPRDRGGTAAL